MGKQLVGKIEEVLSKVKWSQAPTATELGRRTFEVSQDTVGTYQDDPKVLAAALRTLQTSDSQPYAFAGVASILVAASRERDGSYAEEGLSAAME